MSNDLTFVTNYINNIHDIPIFQTVDLNSILSVISEIKELSHVGVLFFTLVIYGNTSKMRI